MAAPVTPSNLSLELGSKGTIITPQNLSIINGSEGAQISRITSRVHSLMISSNRNNNGFDKSDIEILLLRNKADESEGFSAVGHREKTYLRRLKRVMDFTKLDVNMRISDLELPPIKKRRSAVI